MVFPDCGPLPLGLYPIVDSAAWITRLAPLGISTIQLRIKEKPLTCIEQEIIQSIKVAEKYKLRLFINDYWELALKHHAYGIHLGQEDLTTANCNEIAKAGLRLGISTHCHEEVATALAVQPSYLAYGPVYETTSKAMAFSPRGLARLRYWRQTIDYPLVAIGGITQQRLVEVLQCGVDGVALISEITKAQDPEKTTKQLVAAIREYYE